MANNDWIQYQYMTQKVYNPIEDKINDEILDNSKELWSAHGWYLRPYQCIQHTALQRYARMKAKFEIPALKYV